MAIHNFIKGNHFMALLNCAMLLIVVLLGFVIKGRIDEKFEYKIYSILFRLFIAAVGIALLYAIGFQSNFSRIGWCYIYPLLIFFPLGFMEGMIWLSIFYGILAFLILHFDLQRITLLQIEELRSRFLISFFVVCMLSLFLAHGFRHAHQRLLRHQRTLKESENRYREAYEQLSIEMQERKQAGEALHAEKQRFQILSESAPFGIVVIDKAGTFKYINLKFREIFGYDLNDAPDGRTWFRKAFPDPTYRHHAISVWINELGSSKPGETISKTFTVVCKDGTEKIVNFIPVKLETGEYFMSCEDITDRKRAEEALRESEEKYRTILEKIEDGYYEVDLAGNLTFFNDSMCRIWGYPREELMGMNDRQYTDKENAKKLFQAFNKVYRTGESRRECDWEIIRKDGTKRCIEASVSLRNDSSGKPIGFRGIIRDVTERKQMEEALRQSEEKYRTILEDIEESYFETDLAGNFTFVNDIGYRRLGYSREELIGMNNRQLTDEETAKKVFQAFSEVYRTGEPRRGGEWEIIRKDGTKGVFEISASLVRDSGGRPIGFRGTSRDITERKRAEEALKEKTEELARSNRDLEQFAYVASHDLQEPLRMVTNYVQLLAQRYKGKLDSDAHDFIGFAVDGAIRMWKLINDLLLYSRVGMRGKGLESTDCETVLNQSLNNLKVAIEENGAVVTHDPLPTVMADHLQLGQLFQNLIGNAIKFRGNEPPRIHVSAGRKGNVWTFSVRDNGIGIAPEYAQRIFVIFQRLHGRNEYDGTGIGLAICKRIVERHGGRIWAESEVGKGATFYFTLPASKAEPLSYRASNGDRV
jgi:PAS domain S-box-containing protein